MPKKLPPCIRGLKAFKAGCPQAAFDGETGCPAWMSRTMPRRDNPLQHETISQCVDLWIFRLAFDACGLLEGNQQAIESFRNNMTVVDESGRGVPRPDPALAAVVGMLAREAAGKMVPVQIEHKG